MMGVLEGAKCPGAFKRIGQIFLPLAKGAVLLCVYVFCERFSYHELSCLAG